MSEQRVVFFKQICSEPAIEYYMFLLYKLGMKQKTIPC